MEYTDCAPKVDIQSREYKELHQLLASSTSDSEFVSSWLKKDESSLLILPGVEDDGRHSSVCFIPKKNETELAEIYFTLEQFKAWHPEVLPMEAYILGFEKGRYINLDDERLDALKDSLNITYHDDLCEDIGLFESVYRYALSYALSDRGEVTLAPAELDVILDGGEPEDLDLLKSSLYSCFLSYQSQQARHGLLPGFGTSLYFRFNG